MATLIYGVIYYTDNFMQKTVIHNVLPEWILGMLFYEIPRTLFNILN